MAKKSMDISDPEDGGSKSRFHLNKKERKDILVIVIVLLVCVAIGGLTIGFSSCGEKKVTPPKKEPFKKAAVASDATPCSKVGRDILYKDGSVIDAAVATQFCLGVVIPHSTGIGGGGFLVFYNKTSKASEVFDFREVAAGNATENMFINETGVIVGGRSIAVPGMVKGLHEAWKKYGVLKWEELIKPAIQLAKEGVKINKALYEAMKEEKDLIKNNPGLRDLLMSGNSLKNEGDIIKNSKLAETLEKIANKPDSFYTGDLALEILQDTSAAGGLISKSDLENYKVNITAATETMVGDFKMLMPPPPSSAVMIGMILNIMIGYNPKAADYTDKKKAPLTYHRIVEAFKFAYARRGLLGDPAFVSDIDEVVKRFLNQTLAEQLRSQIFDNMTHVNESYYGGFFAKSDSGTSHTSIIGKTGDAVSVTTSVNYWFGSGIRSQTTGIIYNNEMDDFSTSGKTNAYGYPPSKNNYIKAGKRPLSSMSPIIVIDKNNDVRLVVGASGGSRIITGIAQIIMNNLWSGMNAWDAVSKPRLHHQLLPPEVQIDKSPYKMADYIVQGLKSRGHKVVETTGGVLSNTQAVSRGKDGMIYAKSDPRKHAEAAGY